MKRTVFFAAFSLFSLFSIVETKAFFDFVDDAQIPLWARNSIEELRENNIMTGFGDGTFKPDKNINRAEAVTLLMRVKQLTPSETISQMPFSDVPPQAWFAPAVAEATKNGWIKGFPDGKFHPEKTLNRAEWATLISRAFTLSQEAPNAGFKDVPSQAWFARPIFALVANELIRKMDTHFLPANAVSRADAAWMLCKIFNMPRLMGTSKMNDFTQSTRTESRRTAIKPRNFNANKQGYSIEREELSFTAVPDGEQVSFRKNSDWQDIGYVELKNALKDPAKLHHLTFKFNFEKGNVGPEQSFFMKITNSDVELEQKISRTGEITFTGLEISIKAQETKAFRVFLKPDDSEYFYPNSGKGQVRLFDAGGSMISTFIKDSYDGVKGYRFAPVGFENRKLRLIEFKP